MLFFIGTMQFHASASVTALLGLSHFADLGTSSAKRKLQVYCELSVIIYLL